MTPRHLLSLPLAAALAWPTAASGQIRASEAATVSQTVDGTVLTVEYARPRVRGRSPLFGGVVYWGEVWTPGANWATTLETNKDVTINGQAVPAGKYSVWFVVRQDGWTGVLDPKAKRFHLPHPDSSAAQIWFPLTTEQRPPMEVLTWWFPEVGSTGMTLGFQWGDVYAPLKVQVMPSRTVEVAESVARAYTGRYRVTSPMAPPGVPGSEMEIYRADGKLQVRWTPPPFPELSQLWLLPLATDWFTPGTVVDGALYDVVSEFVMEFTLEQGRAVSFEIRGENDQVFNKGTRLP